MLFLTAAVLTAAEAPVAIDYPLPGSLFPSDFSAPTFLWHGASAPYRIDITFPDGMAAMQRTSGSSAWKPDAADWAAMKAHSPATVTVHSGSSSASVEVRTSKDPVGAPIFYREVPLMPSETEKGVIKPLATAAIPLIAWKLRDVSRDESRTLMTGIHSCANCHSASADGKVMGMDLDGPLNDKGLYARFAIRPDASIEKKDVIAWSTHRGKLGGKLRVGFMSQVSPDGRYIVTGIADTAADQTDYQRRRAPKDLVESYYVANFKDYRFLQVFYPTRGILAWYDADSGNLRPLPGADDPRYVHTGATWSPDGKYLVFSRAAARDPYIPGRPMAQAANDSNETPIQYDLYRVPFHDGKGGTPERIEGASQNGMSNSFPKVSPDGKWIVFVQAKNGQLMRPDSQLYIVPASGGPARRMRCNTSLMNSWHSWSPNGRWLVFSSKSRSPYTQMFLTHIDEDGNDTPAILVENATAPERAVNIPEFLNIAPGGLERINPVVTELYRVIDAASAAAAKGDHAGAVELWRKALDLGADEAMVHFNLANALSKTRRPDGAVAEYEKALALSPDHAEAHDNLGYLLATRGRLAEAVAHFEQAIAANPENPNAHTNLGVTLARLGRLNTADAEFEKALALKPGDAAAHMQLGLLLATQKKTDAALQHLGAAVTADPGSIDARVVYGRLLASESRFTEAIPQFEAAAQMTDGRDPAILDLLGGCYASTDRLPEAIETIRHALTVAESLGNRAIAETLRSRLADYESLKQ
jgi:tetratricopeptide (TPR) repeat protein